MNWKHARETPRRSIGARILLLALMAGCLPSPAPLRVMSFNIRYGSADDGADAWPHRRDQLVALLRQERPDILGLQEALRFQLDEIAGRLPGYRELGVGREDGRQAGEYAALLVRADRLTVDTSGTFWFSDTPDVPNSRHWGNRITRIATWARLRDRENGRAIAVFNVHLDHESQASRERSSELLQRRAEAARPLPVLILGDFNAGETNPALTRLAASGYGDSFRARWPNAEAVGTFHSFRGDSVGDKIDYILASPEWLTDSAGILRQALNGRWPSDHFPVTAVLRLTAR